MAMNKKFNSVGDKVLIVNSQNQADLFPPGYKYMIGSDTYTVLEALYEDNTQMRKILTGDGTIQVRTVDTILKDHREHNFRQLETDTRFVKQGKTNE